VLPPGVVAVTPAIERGRAATATRAYRVNLNMLALVALLTGAFLVFATQSLAVLRRRAALGLLRALGITRLQLQCALLGEGAAIGLAGSLLGALLGAVVAALVLRYLGSDLGNRALAARAGGVRTAAGRADGRVRADRYRGRRPWRMDSRPRGGASSARAGDEIRRLRDRRERTAHALPGLALLAAGALLAWLPPVNRLPLPGYVAIAALALRRGIADTDRDAVGHRTAKRSGRAMLDIAVAQLQGSAGVSTISLAAIIVSFSLMVAMAIMVHSFRNSFDLWLVKLLPADLSLRVSFDSDTGALTGEQQHRIAALPAVARAEFRRVRQVWLRADRAPVALIARDLNPQRAGDTLPLVRDTRQPVPAGTQAAWISESLQDLYGFRLGERLQLPLDGRLQQLFVAGIWRDYGRPAGAVVIARAGYIAATGDDMRQRGLDLAAPDGPAAAALEAAIRASLSIGDALELTAATSCASVR
jgi:putative ABC transport system permease protein